jgi:hypothetical protein
LALWVAAIGTEAVLVVLTSHRRIVRQLPVFYLYLMWVVLSDLAMMAVSRQFPTRYMQAFLIEMPLDSLFQFCVLLELTWSVVRPLQASLSRRAILVPAALIVLAGAAVWPIAGTLVRPGESAQWHLLLQLQQTFSILRILVFLALAGLSQLLAIGWRDRELQIATGLGLYSLMSLGAAAMHTHPASPAVYHGVDQVVMASYFCSLVYWVLCFVQREAPRREFSPRMQSILLSVAGSARASRMAIDDVRKLKR